MRSSSICPDRARRPRRWPAWLLALVAAASATTAVRALDPDRDVSQYMRDAWSSEQGFPGGPVYAFAQTPDGYLWIGTEQGLVRFDGVRFEVVQPAVQGISIARTVLGLAVDADGTLWIRVAGPTLVQYREGRFSAVGVGYGDALVTAMVRGRDGRLLMSSLQHGAMRDRGGRFETVRAPPTMPKSIVIAMAESASGLVWLGTRDSGLVRLGGAGSSSSSSGAVDGLPDTKVNAILSGDGEDLWVGTDRGVVQWNGRELVAAGFPAPFDTAPALSMIRDRAANIWIGTASGDVVRVSANGVAALDAAGRSRGAVTALFEDRDGNLWIGSDRGIERVRDSAFITYSARHGLPSDRGGPIHVDAARRAWIAPPDGGLYRLDAGRIHPVPIGGPPHDVIYSIAGAGHDVWIGRQRGGLTHLRESNGVWTPRSYTKAHGLAQDSIYAVHESRDGTIWAGTLSAGLSIFRDGRFTTMTTADGLAGNAISSIAEAPGGSMWIGTPNGVTVVGHGRPQSYTSRDGLPSNDVTCLAVGGGVVWIGTANGLAFFRDGRIVVHPNTPSFLRESLTGIAAAGGAVWIATSTRVLRAPLEALRRGTLREDDVREYGPLDGLLSAQGVRRHRSIAVDGGGRIWFSLGRGLSMIDPARPAAGSAPAIAHVVSVSADGAGVDLDGHARVPAGRQRLTFSFAGLSLSVPERVRFRYRLDGFDSDWSEPVSARSTVYTNLGPGPYRFRVTASNSEGVWSGREADVAFAIDPRIWQTVWFQVAAIVTGVLGVAGLYRLRVHQVARRLNLRFEERLAERTRIAQDLHDTLLQGFVSASMQLHVAAGHVPDDSPARSGLDRVLQLMGRVIDEGRNAVRGLRSPAVDDDLERAFCRLQQELAIPADVGFRVVVEGRPRPLHPLIRDEVYRIGREALLNAVRHAGPQHLEIELDYAPGQLRLVVRDNGCGIDGEVLRAGREGHWGLSGMRERAERIGGRLAIWSRTAAGTEVELSVPGKVAFQSSTVATPPSSGGAAGT